MMMPPPAEVRHMAIDPDQIFNGVDLSRLPAPAVIEPLDFEAIRAAAIAQFQALFPTFDATVESDPVVKLIEMFAYREMVFRQRVNAAALAVMPAYAIGSDLDNIAALFGVERFIITPANPVTGTPAVLEPDADFRRRMVLAPEGYSVAGPAGAYIFHTLSAHADVKDATATSPAPGEVVITVLSRTGGGTPDPEVLDAVEAALSSDTIRPITDHVTVQAPTIIDYAIEADLTFYSGPDSSIVQAAAEAQLADYLSTTRRLGRDVTRAGIIAALYQEGVQNVDLIAPAADIVVSPVEASNCTAITITPAGTGG